MSSVSMGKGKWSDSAGEVCGIGGCCKVSSLVSSCGRIFLWLSSSFVQLSSACWSFMGSGVVFTV